MPCPMDYGRVVEEIVAAADRDLLIKAITWKKAARLHFLKTGKHVQPQSQKVIFGRFLDKLGVPKKREGRARVAIAPPSRRHNIAQPAAAPSNISAAGNRSVVANRAHRILCTSHVAHDVTTASSDEDEDADEEGDSDNETEDHDDDTRPIVLIDLTSENEN